MSDPITVTHPPKSDPPLMYPSPYRFYSGAVGLGIGCGITWTLALTNGPAQRYITKTHAIILLYGVVLFLFVWQAWMLYRWGKRLKQDRAELEKRWREMDLGPFPWKETP